MTFYFLTSDWEYLMLLPWSIMKFNARGFTSPPPHPCVPKVICLKAANLPYTYCKQTVHLRPFS